jgi:hypothetical protein
MQLFHIHCELLKIISRVRRDHIFNEAENIGISGNIKDFQSYSAFPFVTVILKEG